jgi:hypothetical protein
MKFRPRFSLRTLFLIVTVAAAVLGWLDWQRRIVIQRRQLMDELNACITWPQAYRVQGGPDKWMHFDTDQPTWVQKEFGDVSYGIIILPENASDDLVRRTKYLFPNAYQERSGRFQKLNR